MDDVQSTEVSRLETVPWLAFMQGLGKCPTFEYWNVKASPTQVIFYKLEESGGIVLTEKAVVVVQDLSVEAESCNAFLVTKLRRNAMGAVCYVTEAAAGRR